VERIHYRFGFVLCLIVAAIFVTMAVPHGDVGRFAAVVLQSAVLVAAVVASKAHPLIIRLSIAAAVLGVLGSAAALFGTGEFGDSSSGIIALLYVMLPTPAIATGVLRQFREENAVTMQTMFGVLCLYLLVGLIFGVAFATVQDISGNDFFTTPNAGRDEFLYFSYTTLTTVGYGDLVAASALGRSLAITEALLGQIYLVTVVAVIVSRMRPPARSS
jgi:prepilin signal peptidase PulO-like enzyme (type II secretory pathway)